MSRATRPLAVVFISCLVLALFPNIHAFDQGLQARQTLGSGIGPIGGGPATTPTPSSTIPSSVTTPTSTPTQSASSTSASSSSTTPSSTSSSSSSTQSTTSSPSTTPTDTSTSTSASSSTDTSAHQVTTVVTATPTDSATPSSTPPPSTGNDSGSSSLSTGSIIGLSVAGGVAVIGIVAFLIWKFTRKRFSDFDDNEAIKWPELNTHGGGDSHPLPVHNTGRAGFGDTESLRDASRAPSVTGYADSMSASTTELYPGVGADPYAVPPLPHLNPNQPYRDDPQYYDSYRGPAPNTFDGGEMDASHAPGWSGEAIPLTQMSPVGRTRSPGPQMAYDDPARAMSPQQMASRRSPAPAAALAYGEPSLPSFSGGPMMDGRARSPGPVAGFGGVADRRSPGPQAAYDPGLGYGTR